MILSKKWQIFVHFAHNFLLFVPPPPSIFSSLPPRKIDADPATGSNLQQIHLLSCKNIGLIFESQFLNFERFQVKFPDGQWLFYCLSLGVTYIYMFVIQLYDLILSFYFADYYTKQSTRHRVCSWKDNIWVS